MQPTIGRWPRNTIALPVCAGHLNLANSIFALKRNSRHLLIMMNACTARPPRSMRAIRRSAKRRCSDFHYDWEVRALEVALQVPHVDVRAGRQRLMGTTLLPGARRRGPGVGLSF